jgi:hypothetical protein
MCRTIEAIMAHMAPVKPAPVPAPAKRLTATWQHGLSRAAQTAFGFHECGRASAGKLRSKDARSTFKFSER